MRYRKLIRSQFGFLMNCDDWINKACKMIVDASIAEYPIVSMKVGARTVYYKTHDLALTLRAVSTLVKKNAEKYTISVFCDEFNVCAGFDLALTSRVS